MDMHLIPYIQYTFQIPENTDKDTLITLLSDYSFEGFVETDTGFLAYIPQEKDNSDWINLLADLDVKITFSKEQIPPKNWNEEWEKNYEPAHINHLCEIYASFHPPRPSVRYPIWINPKMSFGTGHHPTTFMMSNFLFELQEILPNKTVLDVGCGTGILAILAKKLGAHTIYAIDNDPVCIENAQENFLKNFSAEEQTNIHLLHSDIHQLAHTHPHLKTNLLLANIQKDIILHDLPIYKEILQTNGYLLLSGILKEYEKEVQQAAQPLAHIRTEYKNEWIAILFQKQTNH